MDWGSFAGGMARGGIAGFRTGYDASMGVEANKRAQERHDLGMEEGRLRVDEIKRQRSFEEDLRKSIQESQQPPATGPSVDAGIDTEPEYGSTFTPRAAKDARAPEEKMLAAAEATYMTAAKHGKMDVYKQSMADALMMRNALMSRSVDAGLRTYRTTGDPSGLFEAYNKYFPDGQNAKYLGKDDQGNVKVQIVPKDGNPQDAVIPKDRVETTIRWLTNPQEMLKAQIALSQKAAEEANKAHNVPEGGILVRGDRVVAKNPKGDQFQPVTTKGEDGEETFAGGFNKNTGELKPAGGIAAPGAQPKPEGSFNRKELPVHKDIDDIVGKTEGLATPNPMGGGAQYTPEGERVRGLANNAFQYHRDGGKKLSPNEAVRIAREGKIPTDANGKAQPALMQEGNKVFSVPVVEWNGKHIQIGPKIDVTDRVRQQQQQTREGAAREGYDEGGFGASGGIGGEWEDRPPGKQATGIGTNRVSGGIRY